MGSKKRPTPLKAFSGRFFLAHMLAYPLGFAAAVAAMPIAMVVKKKELMSPGRFGAKSEMLAGIARDLNLTPLEAAQIEIVLMFTMWVSIVVLVVIHVVALPWSIAAARAVNDPALVETSLKRGYRLFAGVTGGTFVLLGLIGTGAWIWVLTGG
jgi:hypothetical protein